MCLRLCCDPHKLTYVSAIATIIQSALFGTLNLVLILLNTCVIEPPDEEIGGGIGQFYNWYHFSYEACETRHGPNYTLPGWITTDYYPLDPRPYETSVDTNFSYQIAYLALHGAWIIASLILIYGNARKRWGYYIPWLLIGLTFTFMDVTVAAFFIDDMLVVIDEGKPNVGSEVRPMIWSFTMYLRIYIFWFSNLGHIATGLNAFCKTRHKRAKEERKKKKQQKKHERELAEARATAASEARAAAVAETQAGAIPMEQVHPSQAQTLYHPPPVATQAQGVQNMAYEDPGPRDPPPYYEYEPPLPAPAPVPKEMRPFSYLNPGFRPTNPHDVEGMKSHKSPDLKGADVDAPKGQGYFSAIPPMDYDDDDDPAGLPAGVEYELTDTGNNIKKKSDFNRKDDEIRIVQSLERDDRNSRAVDVQKHYGLGAFSKNLHENECAELMAESGYDSCQSNQNDTLEQTLIMIRQQRLKAQNECYGSKRQEIENRIITTEICPTISQSTECISSKEATIYPHGHIGNSTRNVQSQPIAKNEQTSVTPKKRNRSLRSQNKEENWRFYAYEKDNHFRNSRSPKQTYDSQSGLPQEYETILPNQQDSYDEHFHPIQISGKNTLDDTFGFENYLLSETTPNFAISVDSLPIDPAFPVLSRVPGFRCRQEGAIMMHYSPCDGYTCQKNGRKILITETLV